MSTAVIVGHPGQLLWEHLAGEYREIERDFPIHDGELHVIVTPKVFSCIWHWVSTRVADTRRTPLPVVEEARPYEDELAKPAEDPGVSWFNQPPPPGHFQVPIAPWIVLHKQNLTGMLAKAFPALHTMTDSDYLCAWITPYSRALGDKGKTYQDQPDDVQFPNRLRQFPVELVEKLMRWHHD